MSSIFKKGNVTTILMVAIFLGGVFLPFHLKAQQSDSAFSLLRQNFDEGDIFTASFSHVYLDTFTGETQETEGTIWIGSDRYKIISGENIMVVDGDISRVYDNSKNRVIVSDYVEEDDDFAPSRMLQGVDDSYEVTESANGDQTDIHLETEDLFAIFSSVTITLNGNNIPQKIIALDQVDNELTTEFYEGSFITPSENKFRFPNQKELRLLIYAILTK